MYKLVQDRVMKWLACPV